MGCQKTGQVTTCSPLWSEAALKDANRKRTAVKDPCHFRVQLESAVNTVKFHPALRPTPLSEEPEHLRVPHTRPFQDAMSRFLEGERRGVLHSVYLNWKNYVGISATVSRVFTATRAYMWPTCQFLC